jgi:hypothetical protein
MTSTLLNRFFGIAANDVEPIAGGAVLRHDAIEEVGYSRDLKAIVAYDRRWLQR